MNYFARIMYPLLTPDGRYLVVPERLWRAANPHFPADVRDGLGRKLMEARRDVAAALRSSDAHSLERARNAVHAAKVALGERGEAWLTDGAKDHNRHLVKNRHYESWYEHQKNTNAS